MQPLYLDGKHPTDISADGPALAITRHGEATRLIPLYLLSHILTRGQNIHWNQTALIACAEADIPIFFSNAQHQLVAAMRSNTTTPSQDWQRLMRFIEDPDGIDRYKIYLRGKASQIQKDITERWVERPKIHLNGYHRAARIIRSAIRSDLEAELHRRGFRRRLSLLRQAGIDLGADMMKTLEPCVHWIINETWKKQCLNGEAQSQETPARKILLHHYEKKADLVRDTLRALIVSFLYWLGECDTETITGNSHAY